MITPGRYVELLRALLSGDPQRVLHGNRMLYAEIVVSGQDASDKIADLALAEAVNQLGSTLAPTDPQ